MGTGTGWVASGDKRLPKAAQYQQNEEQEKENSDQKAFDGTHV
jgi:hypothetical protein